MEIQPFRSKSIKIQPLRSKSIQIQPFRSKNIKIQLLIQKSNKISFSSLTRYGRDTNRDPRSPPFDDLSPQILGFARMASAEVMAAKLGSFVFVDEEKLSGFVF